MNPQDLLSHFSILKDYRVEHKLSDVLLPDHYISSEVLTAEHFAQAALQHWHIESKLHWCQDVGLKEDTCRIRRENTAENLAAIRHIAMNFLKSEKTFKAGIQRKRKKAAVSWKYLSQVIET